MSQDSSPKQRSKFSVLLVEDDQVLSAVLTDVLSSLGEVVWRESVEQAREILDDRAWDLIVTDIELPGVSGIDLLEVIAAADPDVARLVLSSHSSFEYAVAAIRASADDYMTKPVEPDELLAKATELISLTAKRRGKNARQKVLAVGAHPDDVEIGCGGILLRHAGEGDEVTVLTLTGGEAGGVVAERAQESERAAKLLSAELIHSDLSDTQVSVSDGGITIGTIEQAIEVCGANTVYTHTERDVHQDHRNVHSATLVAARNVPRVYCYQAPSTTVEFHPTRFVAIDEYIDAKIEVIGAYASQVSVRDYLDEELLRATARYWARFADARYAEPLEVVKDSTSASSTSLRSSAESA